MGKDRMYMKNNMFDILHSEDFATIPIIKGTKQPSIWEWSIAMISDIDLSICDVGIDLFRSDIVVVNIDRKPFKCNDKDLIGKMLVETPNGYHIYFKINYSYNRYFGSEKVNKFIDIHGRNRYCVCPPTNGYNLLYGTVDSLIEYSLTDIYEFIKNNLT